MSKNITMTREQLEEFIKAGLINENNKVFDYIEEEYIEDGNIAKARMTQYSEELSRVNKNIYDIKILIKEFINNIDNQQLVFSNNKLLDFINNIENIIKRY